MDLETGSFIVLAAPANTPEDAIETLESTYHEAYQSDEFQQWVTSIGVTPGWLGSEEVNEWIGSYQERTFAAMDELDL